MMEGLLILKGGGGGKISWIQRWPPHSLVYGVPSLTLPSRKLLPFPPRKNTCTLTLLNPWSSPLTAHVDQEQLEDEAQGCSQKMANA